MEGAIFQREVMSATAGGGVPTEVVVTAEGRCWVVWVRSSEFPCGFPLHVAFGDEAAIVAAEEFYRQSHLGLMNMVRARRQELYRTLGYEGARRQMEVEGPLGGNVAVPSH